MTSGKSLLVVLAIMLTALLAVTPAVAEMGSGSFKKDKELQISFAQPVDPAWASNPANYVVFEQADPDILIPVVSAKPTADNSAVILGFADTLNQSRPHVIRAKGVTSAGNVLGDREFLVQKGQFQVLMAVLLGAKLINNFVFTKYLGLCIFFGVSQKRETAIGMGITFTIIMVLSAIFCWALYNFVLVPFHLDFLKLIIFIGTVAIFVQAVDTMLRKVNPYLFKKLGVYLVLIVTNCIILAVPLINADSGYNFFGSLTNGLGAGVGFGLAMFLMASVREKLELASVPVVFRGLPIAFIVTGLFALAFLGFSGLTLF